MTQQYIKLPRGAKRIPKRLLGHVINHVPGLAPAMHKVEDYDHDYAVMDTWGQAMADMKKHGTWPMDTEA